MPKIIYANILWFIVVIIGTINSALARHKMGDWGELNYIRYNYDLMYVGVFGMLALVSILGLLTKKKWGYSLTMSFNYILAVWVFVPVVGLFIANIKNNFPLLNKTLISYVVNIENITVSVVSIIFIVFMKQNKIKSLFRNM